MPDLRARAMLAAAEIVADPTRDPAMHEVEIVDAVLAMVGEGEWDTALRNLLMACAAAYHGRCDAADLYRAVAEAERLTGLETGIVPLIGVPRTKGAA